MDRIFLSAEYWNGPDLRIDEESHRHLVSVLRARAGDRFLATNGEGREALLVVESVERRATRARILEERAVPLGAGAIVTLAVAPPKGERMDTAIEKACEIGVGRIVPILTTRSVVKPEADSARLERWRRVARSAMVQSGQSHATRIEPPALFVDLLDEFARSAPAPRVLLAHPATGATSVRRALAGRAGNSHVALFVGPEGGFTPEEADRARRSGALLVSLGATRLRTETAAVVAAALALDELESGDAR